MTLSVPLRTADGWLVAVLAARLDLIALTTIVGRRAGLLHNVGMRYTKEAGRAGPLVSRIT